MNNSLPPNLFRRSLLKVALFSPFILTSFIPEPAKAMLGPIEVNVDGVKDLPDLVIAIKKAGGDLLPSSLQIEDFYKSFAKAFVDNARKAAEIGMQIPQWVIEQLPDRKVTLPSAAMPIIVFVTILGVIYYFPMIFFFTLFLASILVMTSFVTDELRKLNNKKYNKIYKGGNEQIEESYSGSSTDNLEFADSNRRSKTIYSF